MVTHKITEIICDAAVQVISGTSVRIVRNIHIYSIKKRLFSQPLKQLFLALLTNIQNVLQICQMTKPVLSSSFIRFHFFLQTLGGSISDPAWDRIDRSARGTHSLLQYYWVLEYL